MLTEGMIAVSGEKQPETPVGGTKDGDLEDDMVLKSRQKDEYNNSIWD